MNGILCWTFLQTDFFQDDLFPPTRVTWSETISSSQWFQNINLKPIRMSLKPESMQCLTSSVVPASQQAGTKIEINENNYPSSHMSPEHIKSKQDALKKSVSERVQLNFELEQDNMEGVDSNEWNE
jgi:coronin-7